MKKGFTLIELLVVISIISMLSSIVLATIKNAQTRANDAQRNAIVHQYVIALSSYYQDNGHYPIPSTITKTSDICLGATQCSAGVSNNGTNDPGIDTELLNYLPKLQSYKPMAYRSGSSATETGPIYRCINYYPTPSQYPFGSTSDTLYKASGSPSSPSVNSSCTMIQLQWHLENSSATCAPGQKVSLPLISNSIDLARFSPTGVSLASMHVDIGVHCYLYLL